MRIVAGRHRGTKLATPEGRDTRPTSDRVRESLFSILEGGRYGDPVRDAVVVDAFAGSGALGLEALSRGARHAVFIEQDPAAASIIAQNIRRVGRGADVTLHRQDATVFRAPAAEPAHLVLMDPPYRSGLAETAMEVLAAAGWIGPETLIVVETAKGEDLSPGERWEVHESRKSGPARLTFVRSAG